jgi:uncharacterized membrane-anchored protein
VGIHEGQELLTLAQQVEARMQLVQYAVKLAAERYVKDRLDALVGTAITGNFIEIVAPENSSVTPAMIAAEIAKEKQFEVKQEETDNYNWAVRYVAKK